MVYTYILLLLPVPRSIMMCLFLRISTDAVPQVWESGAWDSRNKMERAVAMSKNVPVEEH